MTDSILTKYLQKHINTQNQCQFPCPYPLSPSVLKGVFVANRLAVPLKQIYNNARIRRQGTPLETKDQIVRQCLQWRIYSLHCLWLMLSRGPTDLSTEMVIKTRGWCLSLACLYSLLEKMWCPSLMGVGLLTALCVVRVWRRPPQRRSGRALS